VSRLLLQETGHEGGGNTLEVLGTIRSVMTSILVDPVFHLETDTCKLVCKQRSFRTTCYEDTISSMKDPLQWCMAILHRGSTIHKGKCTLLHPSSHHGVQKKRVIHDSLLQEMCRLKHTLTGDIKVDPLPAQIKLSASDVSGMKISLVESFALHYRSSSSSTDPHPSTRLALKPLMHCITYLPNQPVSIPRDFMLVKRTTPIENSEPIADLTPISMHVLGYYWNQWLASAKLHMCYHLDQEQCLILGKIS